MKLRKILLLLTFIILLSSCNLINNTGTNFVIAGDVENNQGILMEYNGLEKNITIPENVTKVNGTAFTKTYKRVKNIYFHDNVREIENFDYNNFPNLKFNRYQNGLYLGNKNNPYHVFVTVKDSSLSKLTFHKDTKIILNDYYLEYRDFEVTQFPDKLFHIDERILKTFEENMIKYNHCVYYGTKDNPYLILNSYQSFNDYTLNIHPNTKYIVLENEVVFDWKNRYIKTLNIGKNIEYINIGIQCQSSSIVNINVDPENKHYKAVDNVLYTIDGKELVGCANRGKSVVSVLDGTIEIGQNAFSGTDLRDINFNQELLFIACESFSACNDLVEISLPNKLKYLDIFTFLDCKNLETIIFNSNLKRIYKFAFTSCDNLTTIYYDGSYKSFKSIKKDVQFSSILHLYCKDKNNEYVDYIDKYYKE